MTAIENEVAGFWRDTLHIDGEVNENDNFFHLGGHSLHTMQLKNFVNKKFNVNISIKSIFENPTVGSFSQLVQTKLATPENSPSETTIVSNGHRKRDQRPVSNVGGSDRLANSQRTFEKYASDVAVESELLIPSFGEESLWFVHQFQENKTAYNECRAFKIEGNLNVEALEKSLIHLVARHDNLRKKFIEVDGMVRAIVEQHPDYKLRRIHYSDHSRLSFKDLSDQVLLEDSTRPFDLANEIPFRATLVEFENQYLLALSTHHIVSDAWSFDLIKKELERFYSAFTAHGNIDLPLLSEQYLNYATKERERLDETTMDEHLHFWKGQLSGKIEKLKLPYERGAVKTESNEGGSEEMIIPLSTVNGLTELSRQQCTTLFTTLFAAFQTLLYRYTKNQNIIVATPFANREDDDTKELIGFFVNTLLLHADFSGNPDFFTLLNQVHGNVLDAHEYQSMPFEILASSIRKDTGIDANEIIQVMFAFQSVPDTDLNLYGLKCKSVEPPTTAAKFELTVFVYDMGENGFRVAFEYNKDLFSTATIRRMLNHYLILLESIIDNPDQKVSEFNFVSEEEKDVIVNQWNNTAREIPSLAIHQLFEQQAEKSFAKEALQYGNNILTYGELNRRANQLANHLIHLGISSEDLVGILMNETDDAIVSILAVLKAGGAYLPLDTSYPKDRLLYMLENANVKIVITNEAFRSTIEGQPFHQVLIDKNRQEIFKGKDTNPNQPVSPTQLAYVIYTSGSTGKPKGVSIEHRGVVRLLINTDWVTFNSDTRLLKTAAFSFDVSVKEIWGTLFHGGKLFLCSREDLLDQEYLKERIVTDRINTMYFTSPWLSQLAEIDPTIFSPLKIVMGGGDKLSAKHINNVRQTNPHLEIINVYGPTENSVWSTYYKITDEQIEPVLIGKSIPNSTAYIVDDHMQLLPIGVMGEICLGGIGVARGYINNEEKTKEKFVKDPFRPGGTLYKTGDLGRWLEDGNIEFFGRGDNQIKLRGYRVELGEIEHAIANHESIDEAVVIIQGQTEDDKHLICYYTGQEVSYPDLKIFLKKSLPEYMIPSKLIHLESFPLTHNGKLNRSELQSKAKSAPVKEVKKEVKTFSAPANPTEAKLLKIWEDVLDQKNISVTDNFFQLGGHSLLATKLMAKVKTVFNRNFPVSLFYSTPTIREFAQIISKDVNLKKSNLVPIQPLGNQTPFFVIPGYLFYYHLSKHLGEDQPLYGFEPIPDKSVEEISAIYIQQMQMVQPKGPYFIGGYCAGGIVAYEMARQLVEAGHTVGMLALFEVYTSEGVVSKASLKYVGEKIDDVIDKIKTAPSGSKAAVLFKEFGKLFRRRRITPEERYVIKPYQGHIHLFKAIEGMVGSLDEPYMGWKGYCDPSQLEVIEVPGNHDTMFKEPNVSTVAARLDECIFKIKMANADAVPA